MKSFFSYKRPGSGLKGLQQNIQYDLPSGLVVFLIALPLCIGIAIASGVPPFAGIISAVVGGLMVSRISGSHVTINGPAAGLIVVILGAGESLGNGNAAQGYPYLLAAIIVAGGLLMIAGLLGAGKLGDFFPSSAVHGMLAAIGVIIMSKQIHVALGVKPTGKEPLHLIAEIPNSIMHLNPEVAVVGLGSILILILMSMVKNKWVKMIPAPFVVVLFGIACSEAFNFFTPHSYTAGSSEFKVGPELLVTLPQNLFAELQFRADFSRLGESVFWIAVVSIFLVQGIETLLSASAVDKLDPLKRKSELSRDLSAVGFGSLISASLGGLPMIAEIVRSSANINNGGRTSWANFFHGVFLMAFVFLLPGLIHEIPLAALAGILVFTGYRLASPSVIKHTAEYGRDQLIIFVTTLVVTLLTDLIIGVVAGILLKFAIHLSRGLKFSEIFKSQYQLVPANGATRVVLSGSQVFSNYLSLKKGLQTLKPGTKVVLDFSNVKFVDHTVSVNLDQFARDWKNAEGDWQEEGRAHLVPLGHLPLSASLSKPGTQNANGTGDRKLENIPAEWNRFPLDRIGVPSNLNKVRKSEDSGMKITSGLAGFWNEDDNLGANEVYYSFVYFTGLRFPSFTLAPEKLSDKLMASLGEQDIDFPELPEFSSAFVLKSQDVKSLKPFFNPLSTASLIKQDSPIMIFSDAAGMLCCNLDTSDNAEAMARFESRMLDFVKKARAATDIKIGQ